MNKTVLSISFLIALLVLAPVFSAPLNAQAELTPAAVFIQDDGTILGTNNIVRSGDVYTFSGNISGALIVEKDNVVIDGAGYTLEGGNRGIVLANRQNVTVKNTRLTLEGGYIIDVENAQDCSLIGNTLIGTPKPIPGLPPGPLLGPIAVNFLHSQNITVKNNTITNFFYALSLEWSSGHTITDNNLVDGILGINIVNTTGCTFRNNHMSNSTFSIQIYPSYQYENDLDASNTIDGKPIYYWLNAQDKTIPNDAAYIVLVNSKNILIENASPQGITLATTTNSTIRNVNMDERVGGTRGDGITLLDSSGINLLNNVIRNQAISINIENSQNNTIKGNYISNSLTRGIDLANATNNIISGNTIFNSSYAIAPFQDTVSTGNIITSNNFTQNGFAVSVQGNMQILNNTFTGNDQAVLCYSGPNTISGNTLTSNNQGIILQSTGNILRYNNFTNNNDSLPINGVNFDNDVDSSNILNGKPIYYWVNQHNRTIPVDAGFVVLVNCTGIFGENLILANQKQGMMLVFNSNSTFTNNLIANNTNGIFLYGSLDNQFFGNNITSNGYAVYLSGATGGYPFMQGYTGYNPSSGNTFYRNNFENNNQTLYDVAGSYYIPGFSPSANIWDNGKEGNFWSNYNGTDSNGDGIGDSSFVVYANNTDHYPLMKALPISVPIPEFSVWIVFPLLALAAASIMISKRSHLFSKSKGADHK